MKLVDPAQFCARYFAPDSRPPESTLRRWLATGALPARKIGGSWFVDEDAWLAGGDDLVARVLKAG